MVLGGFRSFHVLALTRQLDHFFFYKPFIMPVFLAVTAAHTRSDLKSEV